MVKREIERQAVIQKKRSIRVGTVLGEMKTTKQRTAPEGEEHKKDKSGNKSPLVPRYMLGMNQEIKEATWINWPD